jgi:hypothetical protein
MSKHLAVFGAFAALLALPAFADSVQEINTAAAHAGMAAAADTPKTLHFHIQHTINCLEGKTGADFNAAPGNPCDDLGNGAIPDSTPAAQKSLKEAAVKAKQALNEPDFEKGKNIAGDVQTILSK